MKITERQLRRIIREALLQLSEHDPARDRDRDGDGDEDFDDVRVARFTASGMPKDKAIARVRRKPLGKK
jgi:hypothetical protein